jgi:hypothetical protein
MTHLGTARYISRMVYWISGDNKTFGNFYDFGSRFGSGKYRGPYLYLFIILLMVSNT